MRRAELFETVARPLMAQASGEGPGAPIAEERFLNSREVRRRYSVTEMSIWRWVRDEKIAFPAPTKLGSWNYWRLSDLIAWERRRAEQTDIPAPRRAS